MTHDDTERRLQSMVDDFLFVSRQSVQKSAIDEWDDETIQIIGEGTKADHGKARMDLLPPELLVSLGHVLAYGADKYGERNWEKGMSWGRVFAALMRHMWAWWAGEKGDHDTGLSHLHHAGCCIAFLIAYEARNLGADDRPSGAKP